MPPTLNNAQSLLRQLKDNWFIIVFIGGLIFSWANFDNRVYNVEKAQAEQTTAISNLKDKDAELQNAIIEIKANYIFIKETLTELKDK